MSDLLKFVQLDRYVVSARFLPSLIVVGPALLAFLPWTTTEIDFLKVAGAGGLSIFGAFFLAQITRDFGKRLEEVLWPSWGGPPSTRMLRHSDTTLAARQKVELHETIKALNTKLHAPTPEEEAADPAAADACYERMTAHLRSKTWGPKNFPLLYDENVSYGFKRNLLALKPFGILCSLACLASGGLAFWAGRPGLASVAVGFVTLIVSLQATKASVKRQAESYARRLFETADLLKAAPAKREPKKTTGRGKKAAGTA